MNTSGNTGVPAPQSNQIAISGSGTGFGSGIIPVGVNNQSQIKFNASGPAKNIRG